MDHREKNFPNQLSAKTILLLLCDGEHATLVEISATQANNLSLFREEKFPLALENISSEKITQHLRKILTSWKSDQRNIHCLLPTDTIFLRTIRLEIAPNLETEIASIIKLEAEQIIPFPLNEIIWDYHILSQNNNEAEVCYAAIRKRITEPLCTGIQNAGLNIQGINAAPTLLMISELIEKNNLLGCSFEENLARIFHTHRRETPCEPDDCKEDDEFRRRLYATSCPRKNSSLTPQASGSQKSQQMAYEISGLEGIASIPSEITLLPASIMKARYIDRRLPFFAAVTALICCALFFCSFILARATQKISAATKEASLLLDQQKKEIIASEKITADLAPLKENDQQLQRLITAREAWPCLFNELHHCLPSRYLWVTKLSPQLEEKNQPSSSHSSKKKERVTSSLITAIKLEGLYLENPDQAKIVDQFVSALKQSSLFAIKEIAPEKIIILRAMPCEAGYAYPFTLFLPLSRPIQQAYKL